MAQKLEEMMNEFRYPSAITTDKAITSSAAVTAGSVVTTGTLASGAQTVTGAVSATSTITGNNAGATTADGNSTAAFKAGAAGFGIYFGAGTPTISAVLGSIYLNSSGSAVNNRMYINNGATAWVAVSTVS